MLLVKWRPEAIVALIEIIDYIEQYNPVAAVSLHQTIVVAAEGLSLMPYGFKHGRLSGTREMVVHPNYLVVRPARAFYVKRNKQGVLYFLRNICAKMLQNPD